MQKASASRFYDNLGDKPDLSLKIRNILEIPFPHFANFGREPGKQRPCLAIQPSEFSEAGLESTVVLPLTTKVSKEDAFPLRVRIPMGTCGLERESDVLVDQMLAWDNSLFHKELGLLPDGLIERVTAALKDFLDI